MRFDLQRKQGELLEVEGSNEEVAGRLVEVEQAKAAMEVRVDEADSSAQEMAKRQ